MWFFKSDFVNTPLIITELNETYNFCKLFTFKKKLINIILKLKLSQLVLFFFCDLMTVVSSFFFFISVNLIFSENWKFLIVSARDYAIDKILGRMR